MRKTQTADALASAHADVLSIIRAATKAEDSIHAARLATSDLHGTIAKFKGDAQQ